MKPWTPQDKNFHSPQQKKKQEEGIQTGNFFFLSQKFSWKIIL